MLAITRKLPGRRAFITGAASGLGRALCRALARDGWTLGMADLLPDRLAEAAAEMQKLGAKPLTFVLDVCDEQAFAHAAQSFMAHTGGRVDLVVNNAGIGAGGAFDELSLDQWRRVVDINLMGVVRGSYFFFPLLRQQGHGHILNIASAAAYVAAPKMAAYNAVKAAVVALTETLHSELHGSGASASVAMPSFFDTQIIERLVGPEDARSSARQLVEGSGLGADAVALQLLNGVAHGRIYHVLPRMAKVLWWFKRMFPTFFRRKLPEIAARRQARAERKTGR